MRLKDEDTSLIVAFQDSEAEKRVNSLLGRVNDTNANGEDEDGKPEGNGTV